MPLRLKRIATVPAASLVINLGIINGESFLGPLSRSVVCSFSQVSRLPIPEPIINELRILSEKGKGRKKQIAKPALNLAKKYKIIKLDTDKKGDDAIIFFAQKYSAIVVTNDRNLRKRLKDISINVVYLRNKQYLVLDS